MPDTAEDHLAATMAAKMAKDDAAGQAAEQAQQAQKAGAEERSRIAVWRTQFTKQVKPKIAAARQRADKISLLDAANGIGTVL